MRVSLPSRTPSCAKATPPRERERQDPLAKAGLRKHALDEALTKDCRVEVPGIYFDFNEATLKPTSMSALQDIAATLRKHPEWRISIEGHTDNIGGVPYNDDLSLRRAASVRSALESEMSLDPANISVKGWGLHRPVESNDTLAGRARNRRVENDRARDPVFPATARSGLGERYSDFRPTVRV